MAEEREEGASSDGSRGTRRVLKAFEAVGCYLLKKCKETVGLELNKVQSVYWKAVQRRMILSQLEDLIDENLEVIHRNNIQVPFEISIALIRNDPAIENYLLAYLKERRVSVAPPRVVDSEETDAGSPARLLGNDEPDTTPLRTLPTRPAVSFEGVDSIHPDQLVRIMKQSDIAMENEEEYLEDKRGFLQQGWEALKFLKQKCKEMSSGDSTAGTNVEETDFSATGGGVSSGFEDIDYGSSSDDDDDLLHDRIYDRERDRSSPDLGVVRGYAVADVTAAAATRTQDEPVGEYRVSKVGGKSFRPAWRFFFENIPFVVSNFRFKHVVKTRTSFGNTPMERDEERRRNRKITRERHQKLRSMWNKAARWPLFTYWLMFVQTAILIITLSTYGFASVGYVPFTEVSLVQQSDLSVDILEKEIVPNIWIGPPRDALILLGANYGPCMRRDRLLYAAIDQDREYEAGQSGCCVRRDGSGCVQVATENDCPTATRQADFVFYDDLVDTTRYSNRSVCGTSPRTCVSPPSSSALWEVSTISKWPICSDKESPSTDVNNTGNSHLTCDVTGRPCCIGIQAECMITTQENCEFLEGRFHEDAFLCSQVDCLKTICGLTPFAESDDPDQLQRLGLGLFLHAGILHLILSLVFDFLILRNLEKYLGWLATTLLYMGSGIGGNIVSAVFVPYSPEVGPAASFFGVIAFFFVFIFFHWEMLHKPVLEMLKYLGILFILLVIGLLPYIDNFARLGGILFGLLFSFIHVHYIPPWEAANDFERFKYEVQEGRKLKDSEIKIPKKGRLPKIILLFIGLLLVIPLYLVAFVFFIEYQSTWDGFTYLNCIIPTSVSNLCRDFGQNVRPRDSTTVN